MNTTKAIVKIAELETKLQKKKSEMNKLGALWIDKTENLPGGIFPSAVLEFGRDRSVGGFRIVSACCWLSCKFCRIAT